MRIIVLSQYVIFSPPRLDFMDGSHLLWIQLAFLPPGRRRAENIVAVFEG